MKASPKSFLLLFTLSVFASTGLAQESDYKPTSDEEQAGDIGLTSLFYNDIGFAVINLNWQQGFNGGRTGVIAGRYDPNDYMNVLGHVNPWTIFTNLASNLDTSVAWPGTW